MEELETLARRTEAVVREASSLMARDFEIDEKGGCENIVTSSDIAVQHFLCQNLAKICPEAGFLCEEEDMSQTGCEWAWIIDPIDGTANYARSIPESAISVALRHGQDVVVGVVYCPALDEMYVGIKGMGSTLNGKPLKVSSKSFREGIMCTAMSTYRKEFARMCNDIIMEVYMQSNDFRRFGSSAVELCFAAAGRCDLYFEMRLMPWDYAAASLILTEAGGLICNLSGEHPSLEHSDLVIAANCEESLKALSTIVRKHVPAMPY